MTDKQALQQFCFRCLSIQSRHSKAYTIRPGSQTQIAPRAKWELLK